MAHGSKGESNPGSPTWEKLTSPAGDLRLVVACSFLDLLASSTPFPPRLAGPSLGAVAVVVLASPAALAPFSVRAAATARVTVIEVRACRRLAEVGGVGEGGGGACIS